jgi:hypothetical protein
MVLVIDVLQVVSIYLSICLSIYMLSYTNIISISLSLCAETSSDRSSIDPYIVIVTKSNTSLISSDKNIEAAIDNAPLSLGIYLSIYVSIYLSICLIQLSIYLSISLLLGILSSSMHSDPVINPRDTILKFPGISIYISIYLSIYLFE